jgi:hypothetical protein
LAIAVARSSGIATARCVGTNHNQRCDYSQRQNPDARVTRQILRTDHADHDLQGNHE